MYYEGKIYRPWMEANSLLIQTTLGCTHNKCTFCDMFREKRFRIRKIEEIFKDIDEARSTFRHVGSIFLIDGNVVALKTEFLLKILGKITSTFPEIDCIFVSKSKIDIDIVISWKHSRYVLVAG